MAKRTSLKHVAIDKDTTTILIAVAIVIFVTVFSLVASKALIKQQGYQARVIGQKKDTLKVLKTNVTEAEKLKDSYQDFNNQPKNMLGGDPKGSGVADGDNARLVLDALPSKYDFPALTSSLAKLFSQYKIDKIEGTDDEVAQSTTEATSNPQAVDVPFILTVNGSGQNVKAITQQFDKSIRPFQIKKLTIAKEQDTLSVTFDAKTYVQAQKKFDVKTEPIK